jgi:hypothetical protein
MECLESTIGLNGGCDSIASNANVYLNSKVGYTELAAYIDQNEFASVDDLFRSLRADSVRELVDEIQAHMNGQFISRTVINQQTIGVVGNTLMPISAGAQLRGVLFDRCSVMPMLNYRVTSVGFIGTYTGNVVITYRDALTGQSLGTDTVAAISGQTVTMQVNRLFDVAKLLVTFDATLVAGYQTKIDCYRSGCRICPSQSINAYVTAKPITAPTVTPTVTTSAASLGGLTLDVTMECNHSQWLCGIKQQIATPLLWKVAETVMRYALDQSTRSNTRTLIKREDIAARASSYAQEYRDSMDRALHRITLPNDPTCFHCDRRSGIYVSIP